MLILAPPDGRPQTSSLRPNACRDEDPELFFPSGEGPAFAGQIDEAKAVCATCSSLSSCLSRALASGEWGIWGGTTTKERQGIARRERAAARALAEAAA
jgi:WhiB family transcriptional regulator, redox-sensing transcriptional regulator